MGVVKYVQLATHASDVDVASTSLGPTKTGLGQANHEYKIVSLAPLDCARSNACTEGNQCQLRWRNHDNLSTFLQA